MSRLFSHGVNIHPFEKKVKKDEKKYLHEVKPRVKPWANQRHPTMPRKPTKRVFIGISGLSADTHIALRKRAQSNNRSVSGEIRTIIEDALAELSPCFSSQHGAAQTDEE
jgi:predicted AlkP superfamily pyrophosphatase or phosphodiesterase